MDFGDFFLRSWQTWAYGGLVVLNLVSALLSRNRKLEIGAYYISFAWILGVFITFSFSGRTETFTLVSIDFIVMVLLYRLADNFADWAGYVFFILVFQFFLHLLVIAFPAQFGGYAWLLNLGFITFNVIMIYASSVRIVRRYRAQ
ncbi:MAG: hypothetical protein Tsb0010_19830 [Parvularculaceae bacterium]